MNSLAHTITALGLDCLSLYLDMTPESLEKLVSWKMPFGKHSGRFLVDLPGSYLAWFAREGFPEGELGQLLELMHTIDHNDLRGLLEPIKQSRAKC